MRYSSCAERRESRKSITTLELESVHLAPTTQSSPGADSRSLSFTLMLSLAYHRPLVCPRKLPSILARLTRSATQVSTKASSSTESSSSLSSRRSTTNCSSCKKWVKRRWTNIVSRWSNSRGSENTTPSLCKNGLRMQGEQLSRSSRTVVRFDDRSEFLFVYIAPHCADSLLGRLERRFRALGDWTNKDFAGEWRQQSYVNDPKPLTERSQQHSLPPAS